MAIKVKSAGDNVVEFLGDGSTTNVLVNGHEIGSIVHSEVFMDGGVLMVNLQFYAKSAQVTYDAKLDRTVPAEGGGLNG